MDKKLKVVFMGTPDFAARHLESLLNYTDKYEISAVYTQPDKPKGRSKKLIPTPVKEVALKAGLKVIQINNFKNEEDVNYLASIKPDILAIVAYGLILNNAVLEIPVYGAINIHASILPKYRGASPIQHTLLNGDDQAGVTSFLLDQGIDTGPVLVKKEINISQNDDFCSLSDKLCMLGQECLIDSLETIVKSEFNFKGIKQEQLNLDYTRKIKKEQAYLDFSQPAYQLHNKIRAFNSWPVCYLFINIAGKKQKLKIYKSDFKNECTECNSFLEGSISFVSKKELHIQTKQGCLSLLEVQLEGKKRVDIASFLNGHKVNSGDIVNK